MHAHARTEVQTQFELFVKAFNANNEYEMWRCFTWPYTEIQGNELLLRYKPTASLSEVKKASNWFYSQIISLDIHASADTAHVIAHTARLDAVKIVTAETSTMYIFKKMSGEWKIFLISEL
ncbi:MAG: hypothetical protein ACK5GU_11535 [Chloroflexota bacterium]|jgi:hypothetical protein